MKETSLLSFVLCKAWIYSVLVLDGVCVDGALRTKDIASAAWSFFLTILLIGISLACDVYDARERRKCRRALESVKHLNSLIRYRYVQEYFEHMQ